MLSCRTLFAELVLSKSISCGEIRGGFVIASKNEALASFCVAIHFLNCLLLARLRERTALTRFKVFLLA